MKTCSKCNETKSFSEFYKDKRQKSGLRPDCKICNKEKSADYYVKNVESIKITHKKYEEKTNFQQKWRQENKSYFVEWKKNNPDYHKKYWNKRKEKLAVLGI